MCPEGKALHYVGIDRRNAKKDYRISEPGICQSCVQFGKCTSAKLGRKIARLANEEDKQRFETQYVLDKEVYDRRKARVELPFGHIKANLKTAGFMLRGQNGVQAESSLLATCFDLRRMMTILGVNGLIERLRALPTPA